MRSQKPNFWLFTNNFWLGVSPLPGVPNLLPQFPASFLFFPAFPEPWTSKHSAASGPLNSGFLAAAFFPHELTCSQGLPHWKVLALPAIFQGSFPQRPSGEHPLCTVNYICLFCFCITFSSVRSHFVSSLNLTSPSTRFWVPCGPAHVGYSSEHGIQNFGI